MNAKPEEEKHKKIDLVFDPNKFILRCQASRKPKKIELRPLLCSAIHQVISSQKRIPSALVLLLEGDIPHRECQDLVKHLELAFPELSNEILYIYNSMFMLSLLDRINESTLLILYSDRSSIDEAKTSPQIVRALSQMKRSSLTSFLTSSVRYYDSNPNEVYLNRPMVIQKSKGKAVTWQSLPTVNEAQIGEPQRWSSNNFDLDHFPQQSFGIVCAVVRPATSSRSSTGASPIEYLSFSEQFQGLSIKSLSHIAAICSNFMKSRFDLTRGSSLGVSISTPFPVLIAALGIEIQKLLPSSIKIHIYADDLLFGPSENLSMITFLSRKQTEHSFHIDLNSYPKTTCISIT